MYREVEAELALALNTVPEQLVVEVLEDNTDLEVEAEAALEVNLVLEQLAGTAQEDSTARELGDNMVLAAS